MTPSATPPEGTRVLLLGGVETRFHRFEQVAPPLQALLARAGYSCTSLLAPDALRGEVLAQTDVLVSITTGGTLTPREERALLGAIAEPKNDRRAPVHFLGIHGASCSFANSQRYFSMLGGRFTGHPPPADFTVEVDPTHSVTRGIESFSIHEEFYLLEMCAPARVLLRGSPPGGGSARHPLGWVRQHGQGKVCYLALGHGPEQLAHPRVQQYLRQAVGWFLEDAARIEPTAPPGQQS